ncbi:class I SAM-dependent methyltransferase [Legionella spiritensis]|uniref:Methyltransferase type 11 domain-containing protein n=1 Tax=Legionella spiritensis TaxID=452 RepID=A0A0W0YY88_LEGSP|nr:class I SAM-dependent methyltransferase [Legionella spiritensis]KTD61849.1 hypothetical protein Lspi_2479 [Legionella spiritensis]SNV31487.1 type 11 methyltransferase [Legionella spiritensis]
MHIKRTDEEAFDNLAVRYDSWFDRHKVAFMSEVAALQKVIPESGEGLEIGVGSGRFASALGIKNGVEPSAALRKMAEQRGVNVVGGVAESLPFSDESFDYALFGTVLCYLDFPEQGLAEARRVLKPEGVLVIAMIDRNSALGNAYETRKHDNPFYKKANFYSVGEVTELLEDTQFRIKKIYQTIFSPLENIKSMEPVKEGHGSGGFVVIAAEK